jgi:hypothetical protein
MFARSIAQAGIVPAIVVMALFGCTVSCAHAGLNAVAELNYINYQIDERGAVNEKTTSYSFLQRYTLMYNTASRIGVNEGYYRLGVGYEVALLNTNISSSASGDDSISRGKGKLLYTGQIYYNPSDLPIRLKAYSGDTRRSTFETDDSRHLNATEKIITPGIATSLKSGKSWENSFLLSIDSSTKSSNSRLNALFNPLPAIMVDYRDAINESSSILNPQDDRLRKLAVVLNRKSNWLHFRTTRFDDTITPANSYRENRYIIGNIDKYMARVWVDMTNWIKVSADGQYVERFASQDSSKQYYYNLYADADRGSWGAKLYSRYRNELDTNNVLRREAAIPLYLNGTLSADTAWSSTVQYRNENDVSKAGTTSFVRDYYASLSSTNFRREKFNLVSTLGLEQYQLDADRVSVVRGAVELVSTKRFSDRINASVGYDFREFLYSGSVDSTYSMQILKGKFTGKLARNFRLEMQEKMTLTDGIRNRNLYPTIPSYEYASYRNSALSGNLAETDTSTIKSQSELKFAWEPRAGLYLETVASLDHQKSKESTADTIAYFATRIAYTASRLSVSTDLYYARNLGSVSSTEYSGQGYLKYMFNNACYATITGVYYWGESSQNEIVRTYSLEQTLLYTYFRRAGLDRRLFDVSESFKLENNVFTATGKKTTAKITASYYPFRNFYLTAVGRYIVQDYDNLKELLGGGEVGVTFNKFQASVNYYYGRRDNSDSQIEKRFSANMRKVF